MRKASFILLTLILLGCGDSKDPERTASPRIVKKTKIESPTQGQKFTVGNVIPFKLKVNEVTIDSLWIENDSNKSTYTSGQFDLQIDAKRVGSTRIKATVFFEGKKETHVTKIILLPSEEPEELSYEVVNTLNHSKEDYTQGLLIKDGFLYESSGRNGYSTLKKKSINDGKVLNQVNLSDDHFGEGLAWIDNQFYQLTYTSGACFVYNEDFERVNSFNYQGEGWGLTEFGGRLLMTNGSEKIMVRDPKTFSVIEEFEVYDKEGKIEYLNELEIINGLIYANIYQEDLIVAIDPETGAVKKRIDMSGLLDSFNTNDVDVLNGIAYDKSNDRIFVTGKLWPKMFEVKFVPKKSL